MKKIMETRYAENVLLALEELPTQKPLDRWGMVLAIRNELREMLAHAEEIKEG
jgi:hypothetical protein